MGGFQNTHRGWRELNLHVDTQGGLAERLESFERARSDLDSPSSWWALKGASPKSQSEDTRTSSRGKRPRRPLQKPHDADSASCSVCLFLPLLAPSVHSYYSPRGGWQLSARRPKLQPQAYKRGQSHAGSVVHDNQRCGPGAHGPPYRVGNHGQPSLRHSNQSTANPTRRLTPGSELPSAPAPSPWRQPPTRQRSARRRLSGRCFPPSRDSASSPGLA